MTDVWRLGAGLEQQALPFLPGLAFNLALSGLTAAVLWLSLGGHAGPFARRTGILMTASLLAGLLIGFLALALALAGWFSPASFYALWAAALGLGLAHAVRSGRWRDALASWRAAAPLPRWLPLLLLLWLLLYTRPFELVVGGRDPGIYVNTAAQIATTGRLALPDPFFARLSAEDQALLTWQPPWLPDFVPHKWPGFFWNAERAEVTPQFVYFYPALMAASYAVAGHGGALTVLPLVSLLFALVLAELAEHISGAAYWGVRWRAPVAALGLLLNPASYWFGRYANADVLFGLWVWAALLFWARTEAAERMSQAESSSALSGGPHDQAAPGLGGTQSKDAAHGGTPGRAFSWTLAALTFGAALLTKIDSWYIAPAVLVALLVYHPARGTLKSRVPWLAWMLVAACYLVMVARYSYPYMLGILAGEGIAMPFDHRIATALTGLYLAGLTVAGLLPDVLRARRKGILSGEPHDQAAPGSCGTQSKDVFLPARTVAIAGLCLALTLFFAWSLPSNVPVLRPLTILNTYLGPVLLLAAALGIGQLIVWPDQGRVAWVLLAMFFTGGLFIITRTYWTDHPWAIRRAVSVAIPALVLFAAWGLDALRGALARTRGIGALGREGQRVVSVALAAALLLPLAWRDIPIFRHMEVVGAQAELLTLETVFPPGAVILSDGSRLLDLFGPALSRNDREVLSYYGAADRAAFTPALRDRVAALAAAEGRPFYFLTEVDAPPEAETQVFAREWWEAWPEVRLLSRDAAQPLAVERTMLPVRVYRALPAAQATAAAGAVVGWYEAEALPGETGTRSRDAAAGNGWARVAAEPDASGALVYGPYVRLAAGRYEAHFRLRYTEGNAAPPRLAVQAAVAGQLAAQAAPPVAAYTDVILPFAFEAADTVEFTVMYQAEGEIWLDRIEVVDVAGE